MPIFARRRLQSMLDELSVACVPQNKAQDLRNRLENKRIDQALPAEAELALLWTLNRLGPIEVEPYWWGDSHQPGAYTESLVPERPSVVEVAAVSDGLIAGTEAMDRTALQMSEHANRRRSFAPQFKPSAIVSRLAGVMFTVSCSTLLI